MSKQLDPKLQLQAFDCWLNGFEDDEISQKLQISVTTIERWRIEHHWLEVATKIRNLSRQEYEYMKAREMANKRIQIDDRHKRTLEVIAGKVLKALQEEEKDLTSAQKLHNYSVAGSTLLQLMTKEREIYGITNSVEDEKQKGKTITFQVLGSDSGMIDPAQLERELEGQDPYAVPELHELNQSGNILRIGPAHE